jgi:pimeloyl-ACP methyl ester carboxylesterase
MGFGVVSLLDAAFRRAFTSAGLRPGSAAVDADTTIHFWAHRSLLLPSSTGAATTDHQQRPVVVLIHGFGPGPTWQWASQVGPLSRHFDLVVPTLLFFGASRTRAPARSEASQAAAVTTLLTGGRHLPGLVVGPGRPVLHLVGASYGGIVAYHLARALLRHGHGGGVALGKVVLCDSDVTKGPEDDRALAARGGVEEVTELMVPADTKVMRRLTALSFHRPPKYMPECIARDLLRVRYASRPPYIYTMYVHVIRFDDERRPED